MSTMNSGEPNFSLGDYLREHPKAAGIALQVVGGLLAGAFLFWLISLVIPLP